MSTADIVRDGPVRITGTEEVRQNLDQALFEEDILHSLVSVEWIVAIGDIFHIEIPPAQVDRKM